MSSFNLDSKTITYAAVGALVGWYLATGGRMRAEPELFAGADDMLMAFDESPPATAPMGSVEDLGPVVTLGARPLGGRTLGGSVLGSLRPRRVYQDATSNNPSSYRPPSSVSLRPKAAPAPTPAPATKAAATPALQPASTAKAVKGVKIATKSLKSSPFAPEIDSRDGMIVQPFR